MSESSTCSISWKYPRSISTLWSSCDRFYAYNRAHSLPIHWVSIWRRTPFICFSW